MAHGSRVDALVSNADLAPTFVDWAGTAMPVAVDGRSFAPAIGPGAARAREAEPIGYVTSASADADRFPTWKGVKTTRYTNVEYRDGERELYDDAADPLQLTSIAATASPTLLKAPHAWTVALEACAGARCRKREDAPVP
jgi:arylsulfatase A-like enzyme